MLLDIFRAAIVEGHIERKPAEPTPTPTQKVKRSHLLLPHFEVIRAAASAHSGWLPNACDIAWSQGSAERIYPCFGSATCKKIGFLSRRRKPGPLTPDGLTQAFSDLRDGCGLDPGLNPPPYPEIRSLASRLYEKERGEEFAQRRHLAMTKKYLDSRGSEYVMV